MRRGGFRLSKRAVFTLLMLASILTLFLPPRWTNAIKHSTQLFVPFQDLADYASHRAFQSVWRIGDPQIDEKLDHESLMHQIASQAGLIQQLRQENQRLGALRNRAIPHALMAKVVARDTVSWRNSVLVERGSELGVRRKDWAASRLFINQGYLNKVTTGQAIIAREVLLGRVEQVSPYMSRIQLFSDIQSQPIEVRIGSLRNQSFEFVDYPCSLRGAGRGRMRIVNIDYRYIQEEVSDGKETHERRRIHIGDYVCSAPGQLGLPESMVIGRVSAFEKDPKRRLVFDVVIDPAIPIDAVRTVHVIPLIPTKVPIE